MRKKTVIPTDAVKPTKRKITFELSEELHAPFKEYLKIFNLKQGAVIETLINNWIVDAHEELEVRLKQIDTVSDTDNK